MLRLQLNMLPVTVGTVEYFIFKFSFHDILCNITQQLIKTDTLNSIHENESKHTEHNRLDANSFVSVQLLKRRKKTAPLFVRVQ